MSVQLVYKYNDVGVVYFPTGKLDEGGTCEFATSACLKNCLETTTSDEPHQETYNYIMSHTVGTVVKNIKKNMERLGVKILSWFASGDCTSKDQEHLVKIMMKLSTEGIIQHGFTRNVNFWHKVNGLTNSYFILTVETVKEKNKYTGFGTVAIPDYKTERISLYKMERETIDKTIRVERSERIGCSGSHYYYSSKTIQVEGPKYRENNCQMCYNEKEGCFK